MSIGARKIEVPHIQRNATLEQLLLPTGMLSTVSIFMGINRRGEALGISPSCSSAALSIPDRFAPAVNDISMDHAELILRFGRGIKAEGRDRTSRTYTDSQHDKMQ
jgi:hypothetical protein